jgi:hypothetical protein
MTSKTTILSQSAVPSTHAEAAVAAASWERQGILGRLVRLDEEVALAEQPRRAPRTTRAAAAAAAAARSH